MNLHRIVTCSTSGYCNGMCREGRDCPMRNVHTSDGGRAYRDGKVFPLTVDSTETMPERFRTRREPDPILFAAVTVARFLPVAFVLLALATFFVLDIWSKP